MTVGQLVDRLNEVIAKQPAYKDAPVVLAISPEDMDAPDAVWCEATVDGVMAAHDQLPGSDADPVFLLRLEGQDQQ